MENIEFYRNRNLGERLSVAGEFIRREWKILYKLILIPAIPLALVVGYFQHNFFSDYFDFIGNLYSGNGNLYGMVGFMGLFLLASLLITLVLTAISGAVMSRYEEGLLTKETTLKDLKRKIFSNMNNLFFVGLTTMFLFVLAIVVFFLIIIMPAYILPGAAAAIIGILLLFIVLFAILPPLSLVFYPALFQNASVWQSIGKGFRLGFKNWSSTFVILIIVGLITGAISLILQLPYTIFLTVQKIQHWDLDIVSYALSCLSSIGSAFVMPLSFIFLAFQYFSITEKDENISLLSKIEEFDNL